MRVRGSLRTSGGLVFHGGGSAGEGAGRRHARFQRGHGDDVAVPGIDGSVPRLERQPDGNAAHGEAWNPTTGEVRTAVVSEPEDNTPYTDVAAPTTLTELDHLEEAIAHVMLGDVALASLAADVGLTRGELERMAAAYRAAGRGPQDHDRGIVRSRHVRVGTALLLDAVRRGLSQPLVSARLSPQVALRVDRHHGERLRYRAAIAQ